MKAKILILLLSSIIALLAILSTGCDGYISADGTVYEWVNAPAGSKGEIYVDLDAPTSRITNPIPGVNVTVFRRYKTVTDNTGAFHESSMVAPGRLYMMDIKIEKEGYIILIGKYQLGGRSKQRITIFMVRK